MRDLEQLERELEKKQRPKRKNMKVSGKSVFGLQKQIKNRPKRKA